MSDPLATGILLKLDVTTWTGSAALSAPDLGLDPGTVAAHYTLGRKRLVPKAALDPIATIVRQARYALDGLSHALPDGSRFVLAAATPEVEAQLTRTRARFGHAVETFLAGYPRWRAEMAPQWDAAARAAWHTAGRPGDATTFVTAFLARVAAAYPMADALRRRFDFFWWTYSLRVAGTERVELIGLADAERARRTADATYRAEVEARVAAALEQSLAGFRAQLAEAARPSSHTSGPGGPSARARSPACGEPSSASAPSTSSRTTRSSPSSPRSSRRAWTASIRPRCTTPPTCARRSRRGSRRSSRPPRRSGRRVR